MYVDSASGNLILQEDATDAELVAVDSAAAGTIQSGDRCNRCVGAITTDTAGNPLLAIDGSIVTQDQPPGWVDAAARETVKAARTQPIGTEVTVSQSGQELEVYAVFPGSLFCQETDSRTCGIRIMCDSSGGIALNSLIHATGKTGYDSVTGEWLVDARQATDSNGMVVIDSASNPPISPLGMVQKVIGGFLNNSAGEGITDTTGQDITGVTSGLFNLDSLVTTWGRVVFVDSGGAYILLDDGSSVGNSSPSGIHGLKVALNWPDNGSQIVVPPPQEAATQNWALSVTGAGTCEDANGIYYRVIRPRGNFDIRMYAPAISPPSISITVPPDSQFRQDQTTSTVEIAGTASDGTCIVSVQVAIATGLNQSEPGLSQYSPASYSASSGTWWKNWPHNGTDSSGYTIWAKTINFGGLVTKVSRSVTFYPTSVIYVDTSGNDNNWGTRLEPGAPDRLRRHQPGAGQRLR